MTAKPSDRSDFVRRIFEEGARYMDQLVEENERLRLQLARERDRTRATSPEEVTRLRTQLSLAQEDADSARRQLDELRAEIERVTAENREFADVCVRLQEQQAALSSLYTASYELHASLDLQGVLDSLMEIIINLLGSESFGIYLADERHTALKVVLEVDLPPLAPRTLEIGHGVVGRAVLSSERYIEPEQAEPGTPLVVVPLRVHDQPVGVLAIHGLLAQKKGVLTDLDRELLRLVSAQAATALHGAMLYAKEARRAATFEGLVDLIRSKPRA